MSVKNKCNEWLTPADKVDVINYEHWGWLHGRNSIRVPERLFGPSHHFPSNSRLSIDDLSSVQRDPIRRE